MSVSSKHPDYELYFKRWELVRDVISSNVKKYIKDVDLSDPFRSIRYKDDAQFTNFSGRTKDALVGAIFRREALLELPAEIDYMYEDATGSCVPLNKLAQEITSEVLQTGRFGLLVDYPHIDTSGLSRKDVEDLEIRAYLSKYPSESIINWKEQNVNGRVVLTLVVLKELTDDIDPDDGFEWVEKTVYRVLRLVNGVYYQEIWNEDEEFEYSFTPLDANGNTWNRIPFQFVGSSNNDTQLDPAPLYDMSRLNIGHLRNSADYEESVHITGQPTLFITTSLSSDEFENANPSGVQIGSRRGHNLGTAGTAQFLQPNANQLADQAMLRKEQQAIMIGAKLITPQATNETAEAARMRHSGETSILSVIANNIEKALLKSLGYALMFMSPNAVNLKKQMRVELNDQFFDTNLDPNMIMAQIQLAEKGVITATDMRNTLRKHGVLQDNRTDAEIEQDPAQLISKPEETPAPQEPEEPEED